MFHLVRGGTFYVSNSIDDRWSSGLDLHPPRIRSTDEKPSKCSTPCLEGHHY